MFEKFRLNKARKKVKNAINDNLISSQESIEQMSKILRDFNGYKYHKHDNFLNLCIFSDVVNIDLTIMLERIRLSERNSEKKLYARVLATVIIDYLENINTLIGRDCLKELTENKMSEFASEFKAINKNFSNFRKENEKQLRDIRNNTIAHKSKNALILTDKIENIDVEEIYNFGMQLQEYSTEFTNLSTKIIYYIVDYMKEGRKL